MNNFDDIFDNPTQPESAAPEQEQPQKKLEWWQIKEQKQRKEAYDTLDNIFNAFSEGKGDVQGYLDTHGRFDRYSARNALLIHSKCPEATQIGDFKYWEKQGAEILKTEKRNPIVILEPGKAYRRDDGTMGQNYYSKEVYDISQTTASSSRTPYRSFPPEGEKLASSVAPPLPTKSGDFAGAPSGQPKVSLDERLLLKALIHKPPVPIQGTDQFPDEGRGAMYDPEQNAIFVKKGMDAPDIFRCVSLELAKAELAAMGGQAREDSGYGAYCVSYMLCKKYGVDTQSYDTSRLNEIFMGKAPEEIKSELKEMENAMGSINSRMAKALYAGKEKNQKDHER